jgi:hypothetical protein
MLLSDQIWPIILKLTKKAQHELRTTGQALVSSRQEVGQEGTFFQAEDEQIYEKRGYRCEERSPVG